jgi:hypothetical protein
MNCGIDHPAAKVLQPQPKGGTIEDQTAAGPLQVARVVSGLLVTIMLALLAGFVAWISVRLAGLHSVEHFLQDLARPAYWIELNSL